MKKQVASGHRHSTVCLFFSVHVSCCSIRSIAFGVDFSPRTINNRRSACSSRVRVRRQAKREEKEKQFAVRRRRRRRRKVESVRRRRRRVSEMVVTKTSIVCF